MVPLPETGRADRRDVGNPGMPDGPPLPRPNPQNGGRRDHYRAQHRHEYCRPGDGALTEDRHGETWPAARTWRRKVARTHRAQYSQDEAGHDETIGHCSQETASASRSSPRKLIVSPTIHASQSRNAASQFASYPHRGGRYASSKCGPLEGPGGRTGGPQGTSPYPGVTQECRP
jgi:hypothetical protein